MRPDKIEKMAIGVFLVGVLAQLAFWLTIAWVIWHFISKWW